MAFTGLILLNPWQSWQSSVSEVVVRQKPVWSVIKGGEEMGRMRG